MTDWRPVGVGMAVGSVAVNEPRWTLAAVGLAILLCVRP